MESDETFLWNDPEKPVRRGYMHKIKIFSLVDRESGQARSVVIDDVIAKTIVPILKENIAKEARIMTDDAGQYTYLKDDLAGHNVVCHSQGEYVSLSDPEIHTNAVEGFFSIFKRGMKGVYRHCAKEHMHRYLVEFDFRYSNRIAKGVDDSERAGKLLKGEAGKRITYETTYCEAKKEVE